MKTKYSIMKVARLITVFLAGLLLPLLALAAGPPDDLFTVDHPSVRKLIAAQNAATPDLMQIEEIIGTAVGFDATGEMALVIYVNEEGKNAGEVSEGSASAHEGRQGCGRTD